MPGSFRNISKTIQNISAERSFPTYFILNGGATVTADQFFINPDVIVGNCTHT